jgi:hypothetical protein
VQLALGGEDLRALFIGRREQSTVPGPGDFPSRRVCVDKASSISVSLQEERLVCVNDDGITHWSAPNPTDSRGVADKRGMQPRLQLRRTASDGTVAPSGDHVSVIIKVGR